jgi:hypothetical protein
MVPEPPRQRWWLAKRVLVGGVGVVLVSAAATVVLALNEVGGVVEALRESKRVKLAPNARRPAAAPRRRCCRSETTNVRRRRATLRQRPPHSNEMPLVRIDPSKPTISMMSIPGASCRGDVPQRRRGSRLQPHQLRVHVRRDRN